MQRKFEIQGLSLSKQRKKVEKPHEHLVYTILKHYKIQDQWKLLEVDVKKEPRLLG